MLDRGGFPVLSGKRILTDGEEEFNYKVGAQETQVETVALPPSCNGRKRTKK